MLHGIRWVAFLGLLVAGCSNTSDTGTYTAPLCASDGSCADSARCVAGICHDTCAADADCPRSAVCRDAVCWASASGSCTSDADCTMGEACTAGTCTAPPAPITCAGDTDCPAGARCDGGSCVSRPAPGREICGNGIDDDLDGLIDEDCGTMTCTSDSDCGAGERCVRGTCGGDVDADGDGYPGASDCNDADPSINPGATETCNGVDDDCDGTIDEGCSTTVCTSDSDCAAGETCVRGMCAGSTDVDRDGDGYAGASDCNDADASINPGATETCNGVDDNCDGRVDEGCSTTVCTSDSDCTAGEICVRGMCGGSTGVDRDGDGYAGASDCNDADASINPGATETCNGVDDNCDGRVDEGCGGGMTACTSDSECAAGETCLRGYCLVVTP